MDPLSTLFSINGIIIGTAFLPQIITLIKDQSGAVSTSISSSMIFTFVSLVSLAYGIFKIQDNLFIFYSIVALVGNATVLGLALYRRYEKQLVIARPPFSFTQEMAE